MSLHTQRKDRNCLPRSNERDLEHDKEEGDVPVVVQKSPLRAQGVGTLSSCGSHVARANTQQLQAICRNRHA
jgi:hypothetical protein